METENKGPIWLARDEATASALSGAAALLENTVLAAAPRIKSGVKLVAGDAIINLKQEDGQPVTAT
jgi:hypothetical protein